MIAHSGEAKSLINKMKLNDPVERVGLFVFLFCFFAVSGGSTSKSYNTKNERHVVFKPDRLDRFYRFSLL